MAAREAVRLNPFVPTATDTPATSLTKLRLLRERLKEETDFLKARFESGQMAPTSLDDLSVGAGVMKGKPFGSYE